MLAQGSDFPRQGDGDVHARRQTRFVQQNDRKNRFLDVGVRGRKTGWMPPSNVAVDDLGVADPEEYFRDLDSADEMVQGIPPDDFPGQYNEVEEREFADTRGHRSTREAYYDDLEQYSDALQPFRSRRASPELATQRNYHYENVATPFRKSTLIHRSPVSAAMQQHLQSPNVRHSLSAAKISQPPNSSRRLTTLPMRASAVPTRSDVHSRPSSVMKSRTYRDVEYVDSPVIDPYEDNDRPLAFDDLQVAVPRRHSVQIRAQRAGVAYPPAATPRALRVAESTTREVPGSSSRDHRRLSAAAYLRQQVAVQDSPRKRHTQEWQPQFSDDDESASASVGWEHASSRPQLPQFIDEPEDHVVEEIRAFRDQHRDLNGSLQQGRMSQHVREGIVPPRSATKNASTERNMSPNDNGAASRDQKYHVWSESPKKRLMPQSARKSVPGVTTQRQVGRRLTGTSLIGRHGKSKLGEKVTSAEDEVFHENAADVSDRGSVAGDSEDYNYHEEILSENDGDGQAGDDMDAPQPKGNSEQQLIGRSAMMSASSDSNWSFPLLPKDVETIEQSSKQTNDVVPTARRRGRPKATEKRKPPAKVGSRPSQNSFPSEATSSEKKKTNEPNDDTEQNIADGDLSGGESDVAYDGPADTSVEEAGGNPAGDESGREKSANEAFCASPTITVRNDNEGAAGKENQHNQGTKKVTSAKRNRENAVDGETAPSGSSAVPAKKKRAAVKNAREVTALVPVNQENGRGKRHRMVPLKYWCGEQPEYKMRRDSIAGVFVPEIIGIKAESTVSETNRKQSTTRTKRRNQKPQRKPAPLESPEMAVMSFETGAEEYIRCVYTEEMMDPQYINAEKFKYQRTFTVGDFLGSGVIIIPKGGTKPNKSSGAAAVKKVFFVVYGTVRVRLHRNVFEVSDNSQFLIPRGNQYSIENIGNDDAHLVFMQARVSDTSADQNVLKALPAPSEQPSQSPGHDTKQKSKRGVKASAPSGVDGPSVVVKKVGRPRSTGPSLAKK
ncbi:hypothetical protein HDU84_008049 [Entophlyctis sp. JEL0112]|nr:hypothetical protein HDU84_008049 [Entophlyctis sp. JEL0112]